MMMWMPQKLRDSGYSLKGDEPLKGGELNLNILIENQKGELFCLRRKKRNNRRAVDAYLRALYEFMGFYDLGGRFVFRNIPSQVAFLADCLAVSVNVPEVVDFGKNWMLTSFIIGVPLKDRLTNSAVRMPIFNFLGGLLHAHSHKIVLVDRWGGNEIVTDGDDVAFLDFDIQLQFDGQDTLVYSTTYDLAVALRTCLLWPENKIDALSHILEWFQDSQRRLPELYDFPILVRALIGACNFYDSPARPINLENSLPLSQHYATNTVVHRLADYIEQSK